ncbi:MAG: hypothetical protein H9Q65_05275 [Spiroplasma ixodetis]|nr:hypothetical protein [Spiroplasma ixodetis]MBP1528636.1 hypothetical protein [Spiroplasma ixodetis]
MKSTLIENINSFWFEKNDDKLRNPPLHQIQKTQAEIQRINSKKIKNENGFVYKTEVNREVIYEYFLNKVKDVNGTCLITRIYCENGEIWEKAVYIDNKENNIEQKIIEQFRFFSNKQEYLQAVQTIKDKNDSKVFIRKKSILLFKNKKEKPDKILNSKTINENKYISYIKKWILRPFIFITETYIFGVISGFLGLIAGKGTLLLAFEWWTPISIWMLSLIGTNVPIVLCIGLAILLVTSISLSKDYVIKPLLQKIKKWINSKKDKKIDINDLNEINFHNTNSRVLKNYLSCQKQIPFDKIKASFEQNINILKNRKLSNQTQEKFNAKSINNIPISANTWNKVKCLLT